MNYELEIMHGVGRLKFFFTPLLTIFELKANGLVLNKRSKCKKSYYR